MERNYYCAAAIWSIDDVELCVHVDDFFFPVWIVEQYLGNKHVENFMLKTRISIP